jgi:intracellular sulfur oxidation DsrE/DsrF family protein
MRQRIFAIVIALMTGAAHAADTITLPNPPTPPSGAQVVTPPYGEQKVVFDFYFDEPHKINAALYWVRSWMKPLIEPPYNYPPEFLDAKIVIHGTEIAALAKRNYKEFRTAVERMRYYVSLGLDVRVCGMALEDYGYAPEDLHDFVRIVPSAMADVAHWQSKGYSLITPQVLSKKHRTEDIR